MEDEDEDETGAIEGHRLDDGDSEYAFEGFKVEFSERIALTPPATARPRA